MVPTSHPTFSSPSTKGTSIPPTKPEPSVCTAVYPFRTSEPTNYYEYHCIDLENSVFLQTGDFNSLRPISVRGTYGNNGYFEGKINPMQKNASIGDAEMLVNYWETDGVARSLAYQPISGSAALHYASGLSSSTSNFVKGVFWQSGSSDFGAPIGDWGLMASTIPSEPSFTDCGEGGIFTPVQQAFVMQ